MAPDTTVFFRAFNGQELYELRGKCYFFEGCTLYSIASTGVPKAVYTAEHTVIDAVCTHETSGLLFMACRSLEDGVLSLRCLKGGAMHHMYSSLVLSEPLCRIAVSDDLRYLAGITTYPDEQLVLMRMSTGTESPEVLTSTPLPSLSQTPVADADVSPRCLPTPGWVRIAFMPGSVSRVLCVSPRRAVMATLLRGHDIFWILTHEIEGVDCPQTAAPGTVSYDSEGQASLPPSDDTETPNFTVPLPPLGKEGDVSTLRDYIIHINSRYASLQQDPTDIATDPSDTARRAILPKLAEILDTVPRPSNDPPGRLAMPPTLTREGVEGVLAGVYADKDSKPPVFTGAVALIGPSVVALGLHCGRLLVVAAPESRT
ncbi:hypothetical protein KIPB_011704, partial [Kipferlia bialata]|eukprot:g11704.t1